MNTRFYVRYNHLEYAFDVIDSLDEDIVNSFYTEADAFSYCDGLNTL